MCRPAAWHAKKRPRTFTSNSSSHSSSVASSASWFVPSPALFTRMSSCPNRSIVSETALPMDSRRRRSISTGPASPPAARISSTTASTDAGSRPAAATRAPAPASATARSRPMPLFAPVTSPTCPLRSNRGCSMAPSDGLTSPTGSPGRRLLPQVDPGVGRVAVDLFELVLGEPEVAERPDVVLQLGHAACADQRGRDPRVPERPGHRHLRERLPPPLREVVQGPDLRHILLGEHLPGQCAERLLERSLGIEPVGVEDVDVVEAHPGERPVEAGQQVFPRTSFPVRPRPHVPACLRGDDELVPVGPEVVSEDP